MPPKSIIDQKRFPRVNEYLSLKIKYDGDKGAAWRTFLVTEAAEGSVSIKDCNSNRVIQQQLTLDDWGSAAQNGIWYVCHAPKPRTLQHQKWRAVHKPQQQAQQQQARQQQQQQSKRQKRQHDTVPASPLLPLPPSPPAGAGTGRSSRTRQQQQAHAPPAPLATPTAAPAPAPAPATVRTVQTGRGRATAGASDAGVEAAARAGTSGAAGGAAAGTVMSIATIASSLDARIKQLEDVLGELSSKVNRMEAAMDSVVIGSGQADMPNILGVWTQAEMLGFSSISHDLTNLYLGGTHVGVTSPDSRLPLCAHYKNQTRRCVSKEMDPILRKYVSKPGVWVHNNFFGTKYVRDKSTADVLRCLYAAAVCTDCRGQSAAKSSFINIANHKKVCGICKQTGSQRSTDTNVPLCADCEEELTKKYEKSGGLVMRAIKVIAKIFYDISDFAISYDVDIVPLVGQNRRIDIVVRGSKIGLGIPWLIVFELDRNEHKGYDMADERAKLLKQSFTIWDNSQDKDSMKMLIIRFNPNSAYTNQQRHQSERMHYDKAERLIIMRQWIIWWLHNLRHMRKCLITYMFYSDTRRSLLCANTWSGFAMLYDRPEGPTGQDWLYAAIPSEVSYKPAYENIMRHRVDPDAVIAWKQSEVAPGDEFPPNWG